MSDLSQSVQSATRPRSIFKRLIAWVVWLGALGILGLLGYAMLTGAGKPGRRSGGTINNRVATLALLDRPAPDFSLTFFGTGEVLLNSEIAIAFGLTGIPATHFIAADGMIAQKPIGTVQDESC